MGCAATGAAPSFATADGWTDTLSTLTAASPRAPSPTPVVPDPLVVSIHKKVPPPPPRCPEEMALVLDAVCVDKWESTLVLAGADGTETAWSPFRSPGEAKSTVRAVSQPGVVPQGYISGEQAAAACEAAGKRLCTTIEWEAGCRGRARTTYPYGDQRRKGICNDSGRDRHPVGEVHQKLGLDTERMWYEGMSHPLINQLENTVRKTGELAGCTSDVGTYDMVGNLHEWIADPEGTFRGGFYMDTQINGEGCDYATTAHPSTYADYSTGFRCCRDAAPKPTS
jgi:hypothetical protein